MQIQGPEPPQKISSTGSPYDSNPYNIGALAAEVFVLMMQGKDPAPLVQQMVQNAPPGMRADVQKFADTYKEKGTDGSAFFDSFKNILSNAPGLGPLLTIYGAMRELISAMTSLDPRALEKVPQLQQKIKDTCYLLGDEVKDLDPETQGMMILVANEAFFASQGKPTDDPNEILRLTGEMNDCLTGLGVVNADGLEGEIDTAVAGNPSFPFPIPDSFPYPIIPIIPEN